jgi:hypothetical protein
VAAAKIWLLGNANERRDCSNENQSFQGMYVAEVQELVSVESQLLDALLRMAGEIARSIAFSARGDDISI